MGGGQKGEEEEGEGLHLLSCLSSTEHVLRKGKGEEERSKRKIERGMWRRIEEGMRRGRQAGVAVR